MSDLKYKMITIPSDHSAVYLCVRLWSAKGKAVEQIKNELKNLNGYSLVSDALNGLYAWLRQKVEDAQATSRSKFVIGMDERSEAHDHNGNKCQTIQVFSTKMNGDSLSYIATIYAMPISGVIAFNASPEEKGGEA
ncbi:MAG: hypothetical protein PUI88_01090 [Prevotella sp.]|nr:hypothetical protein [Prevotella sp.]